jgi:homeobox-leucine zipper protein
VELLNQSDEAGEALLKMLWHHPDAVLCCSFKVSEEFCSSLQYSDLFNILQK